MKEDKQVRIDQEVSALVDAIGQLPMEYQHRLSKPLQDVCDSNLRRKKILNLVQEALSQLRLDMKYLVFDLEATRRERDKYREELNKRRD